MKYRIVSSFIALSLFCTAERGDAIVERSDFFGRGRKTDQPSFQRKKPRSAKNVERKSRCKKQPLKSKGSPLIDGADDTTLLMNSRPNGLLLVGAETYKSGKISSSGAPAVTGLETHNLKVPGGVSKLHSRLAAHYFDKTEIRPSDIHNVKKEIIKYYRENNQPVVHVYIPQQKIKNNVLQLVVVDPVVGEIRYRGHKHFKSKHIAKHVRQKEGEQLRSDLLADDLNFINRNYFRQTNAVFIPGNDIATTNIEFITQDRHTWRPYAGVDNTGYEETGHMRWYTGVNFGNLLDKDYMADYQFTTANDPHDFMAHTGKIVTALPWKHWLMAYGGYSIAHVKQTDTNVKNDARNLQLSLRYEVPLRSYRSYLHELTIGYDYKRTNNDIFIPEHDVIANSVNISQFMIGYNIGYRTQCHKLSVTLEGFWSPGELLPDMDKKDFSKIREHADANYAYCRLAIGHNWTLPYKFDWRFNARFQAATSGLLPTEEQGVGGYDTVRGYRERALNGDHAAIFNFELRTPPKSLLTMFTNKNCKDVFQILGFVDYGYVNNISPGKFEAKSEYLLSMGPGIRYHLRSNMLARLDYGIQLHDSKFDKKNHTKLHFGLIVSY